MVRQSSELRSAEALFPRVGRQKQTTLSLAPEACPGRSIPFSQNCGVFGFRQHSPSQTNASGHRGTAPAPEAGHTGWAGAAGSNRGWMSGSGKGGAMGVGDESWACDCLRLAGFAGGQGRLAGVCHNGGLALGSPPHTHGIFWSWGSRSEPGKFGSAADHPLLLSRWRS